MRRARSSLTVTALDGVVTTVQLEHCCHCGGLLGRTVDLATQRLRGEGAFYFCSRCNALSCSSCRECRPQEKMCENVEAGRAPGDDGTAVKLFLPVAFPGK